MPPSRSTLVLVSRSLHVGMQSSQCLHSGLVKKNQVRQTRVHMAKVFHGRLTDGNESDASRYATTACLLYDVPTRGHILPSACPVLRWAHSHTLVTKTTIPDVVVSECIPLIVPASVYPTASAPCPQIDFAFKQPGALPLRPAHTRRGMPAHLVSSLAAVQSSCGCRSAWLDSHTQPFFGSHEYAHWTHVLFTTCPLPCGRLSEVWCRTRYAGKQELLRHGRACVQRGFKHAQSQDVCRFEAARRAALARGRPPRLSASSTICALRRR